MARKIHAPTSYIAVLAPQSLIIFHDPGQTSLKKKQRSYIRQHTLKYRIRTYVSKTLIIQKSITDHETYRTTKQQWEAKVAETEKRLRRSRRAPQVNLHPT